MFKTVKRIPAASNNKRWSTLIAASTALLLTALVTAPLVRAESAESRIAHTGDNLSNRKVFALTKDGNLVRFRAAFPHLTRHIGYVYGLSSPDTALVGIDFRVQDGKLYGVGNGSGVYTIDTSTAQAYLVNRLTVPLDPHAKSFGVDFNPAADRLRIISDMGQSLSHDVNVPGTGTANQGVLTYPVPPPTPVVPALQVTGAAYTNNDLSSLTGTTLFDIDGTNDQVAVQSPAPTGLLVLSGKLGVDADPSAIGFDIASNVVGGVTVENRGYASLRVNGSSDFYRVSLLTGKLSRVGKFRVPVIDIAVTPQ